MIAEKDGYCRIVSLANESMCIAVTESTAADGVNVVLQTYTGADNQLWKLKKDGTTYGLFRNVLEIRQGWTYTNGQSKMVEISINGISGAEIVSCGQSNPCILWSTVGIIR